MHALVAFCVLSLLLLLVAVASLLISFRLFLRLWSFWHATAKSQQAATTTPASRLMDAASTYPEIVDVIRDLRVIAKDVLRECEQEDAGALGELRDDKFLAIVDRQGVRMSHTQIAYLLMLLENEGFRRGSSVRYAAVVEDLVGSAIVQALHAPQDSRPLELTGQQLLDEVQRRWSYARSLLPLRIVKEDLVDAFKHIGFPLSPAQATELWRGLSDAVSLRANSRTETFLDKSDVDRILSLRTTSEKSDIDLAARGKKASRVSARNQQNISENIFSFATEQPRPQPRPLSAMCVQPGRVRSTYDPTDLFGGKPAPPNVFLRARKHVSKMCVLCVVCDSRQSQLTAVASLVVAAARTSFRPRPAPTADGVLRARRHPRHRICRGLV